MILDNGGGTPSSTVVPETTPGLTPDPGASFTYARGDHTHGTPSGSGTAPDPSDTVTDEITFGETPDAGASTDYSRGDHTHGTPDVPDHDDLGGVTSDQHHLQEHEHDGLDGSGTVDHTNLTGVTTDQHHDFVHHHEAADGSGTVSHVVLTGVLGSQHIHEHGGGADNSQVPHANLSGVSANQHHNEAHTHNGSDGSSLVDLSEIEVDLGTIPVYDGSFTVTDARVVAASIVVIKQSGKAASGLEADENEMDRVSCSCFPGIGDFLVYFTADPGPVSGLYKFEFLLGA